MALAPRDVAVRSIVVAVRKRPKLVSKEADENDVVRCEAATTVVVYEPKTKVDLTPVIEPSIYSFDHVFDETAGNAEVYETCCRPLLQDVKDGGGAVVFAFGQTGSGKTYTMLGRVGECQGLYGFIVRELLATDASCTLSASFYEVYGVKLFDLLNGRAEVKMLQDEFCNLHIVGLSERDIAGERELSELMSEGQLLRASGTTHANDRSSRSHAVLEIKVRLPHREGITSCGRMTLVDLAGSERAADTADTDIKMRREGAEINKSLLALKECIRAMSMRKRHIPFRASKLTQILRESFVGRSKTCVIANISPCQRHCEDTLNTLRYAHRIKELKGPTNGGLEHTAPRPCQNCGLPIFAGDKHVCARTNVECPHCRQEMAKQELEAHLAECKQFPMRCPHCNERLLRAELPRHNRRCARLPVRCPLCSSHVIRCGLEKHTLTECGARKEKCRYCGVRFPRHTVMSHEHECDMRRVACVFCLRYIRKARQEAHMADCPKNPNRRGGPSPRCPDSSVSTAASTDVGYRGAQGHQQQQQQQQQRRLGAGKEVQHSGPGRRLHAVTDSDAETSSSPAPSGLREGVECECPYARYGCTQKVARIKLTDHLTQAMAKHLRLVSNYADQMDVENAALRRFVITNSKCPNPH
ncbi:putative MCAK-like kinesin [Trypanosoma rangeli]|uniref:Kinesin-like protein n=1 Tax=Trypanosoma rangeli TaxID=5698 RepID=A0A422NBP2_TRYRA|nr:putative MCAK-like kinesin [Trypanosoma rangeli]RNF02908.1 putative MCAK-like kinesin [Trypanosoma rangeli]|eukprot:RNF02908.1 putative MCAK-like kinesin [Trypanosoma rangeli]